MHEYILTPKIGSSQSALGITPQLEIRPTPNATKTLKDIWKTIEIGTGGIGGTNLLASTASERCNPQNRTTATL